MQSKNLAESLASKSRFVVVAELAAGPRFNFAPIKKFLQAFRQADDQSIPPGFDFVGVTVPQNPGGVANLEPSDVLSRVGGDLLGSLDFIPHVSCKDQNRDALMSSLVGYQAHGITSVLALTGDKPVSSRGVFEIESVGLLKLVERMNYTAYLGAGPGKWSSVRQFFPGAAVSPFKYSEASQMQQYYKMEKKIAAGARFLITQVGWDWKKSLELMQYLKERQLVREEVVPPESNPFLSFELRAQARSQDDVNSPGRDPADESESADHEPVVPENLILSATLMSPDGNLSLVNGTTVAEGETVGSFEVLRIDSGTVVLGNRFGTFQLEIGKESR